MEGQLLYISRMRKEPNWKFRSVPISQAHIDSIKPFSPNTSLLSKWDVLEALIDALSNLCGDNGAMKGW